jgi:hypothetical protein
MSKVWPQLQCGQSSSPSVSADITARALPIRCNGVQPVLASTYSSYDRNRTLVSSQNIKFQHQKSSPDRSEAYQRAGLIRPRQLVGILP